MAKLRGTYVIGLFDCCRERYVPKMRGEKADLLSDFESEGVE